MSVRPFHRQCALLAPATLALVLSAAAPAAAWDDPEVIARGLDNPRGLDIGPGNGLYVAEAGRGGPGPCAEGPEGEVCAGATGAVTRIDLDSGRQERVATGLPSLASRAGGNATGPHDVSFSDRGPGWLVVGLGANPAARAQFGELGARFGWLYRFTRNGRSEPFADLAAFEAAEDPDAGQPGAAGADSNPWSVVSAGRGAVVSDSGGNDLVRVNRRGRVRSTAVFPARFVSNPFAPGAQIPMQSVPTGVVRAPGDGGYYVGELTGFPFPAGAARIYDVPRGGGDPEVAETGFTTVVDLAAARDGKLYVLQIASASLAGPPSPGALIEIHPDGTRHELARGKLTAPTGLAVDDDGALYISHQGLTAGEGEVLRLAP